MTRTVDAFWGEITNQAALLYVRADREDESERWTGIVTGPFSDHSKTLPSDFVVRDLGPGTTVMGGSCIVDPCCWSPALPVHYRLQTTLFRGEQMVEEESRQIALRRLGTNHRSFRFESNRWVLRGVQGKLRHLADTKPYRDTLATLVLDDVDQGSLQLASRHGIPVLVNLDSCDNLQSSLRILAQWPAAGLVVVPNDTTADIRQLAPNLLYGLAGSTVANWCDFWLAEPDVVRQQANATTKPLVVSSKQRWEAFADARSACDRLQQEMAAFGDFAGYIG